MRVQKSAQQGHTVSSEILLYSVFTAPTWDCQITQYLQGFYTLKKGTMWDNGVSSYISNGLKCLTASSQAEPEDTADHRKSSDHLGHTYTPTQQCRTVGVLICKGNPTPRSPAGKLTGWLAVIDNDIYKDPGDVPCSDTGCDVTYYQVLIGASVKHWIKAGASKKHNFKRHPIDFSFAKETWSTDIFPSRQELYSNRFFFFTFPLEEMQFHRDED